MQFVKSCPRDPRSRNGYLIGKMGVKMKHYVSRKQDCPVCGRRIFHPYKIAGEYYIFVAISCRENPVPSSRIRFRLLKIYRKYGALPEEFLFRNTGHGICHTM